MAIYDTSTKNTSFIKMYKLLKDKGIENNKFFLILYDESLRGIDPHSKDLTDEQKIRIHAEVMRNKWYYLREVVRIPESGGSIPFQLSRANLAQSWLMDNNVNIFEVLPRQNGKTIGAECNYTYFYHYGTINTNMIFSNKLLADSKLNIKRFNDISELIPKYLKEHLNEKLDTNNLVQISCEKNNNTIDAMSTARTVADADKLGRGCTVPLIWYDEFAFLKYNDTIYTSAGPAFSKASEAADRNGTPYGILITTTPNDLDTEMGSYAHAMMQDACPFDEKWYDWAIDKVKRFIFENSKNDFVYLEFSYTELGHDEKWYNKQCRILNNDLLKIKREILLEWTLANDTSPFSEEQLTSIGQYVREPIGEFYVMDKYKFEMYKEMRNLYNKSWLVGIDIGGGLQRDFSAITISDPATYEIVAVFKNNNISVPDLADVTIELVTKFIPSCVLLPERNNQGLTFIQLLLKSVVSKNIYYEYREKIGEKVVGDPKNQRIQKVKNKVRVYGIDTNKSSRDLMINEILNNAVNETPHVFTNKHVFNEIRTLERTTRGKIEHRLNCHDDVLFSWLVAMYPIHYGNSVAKFVKVTSDGQYEKSEMTKKIVRNGNQFLNIINDNAQFSELSQFMIQKNEEMQRQQSTSSRKGIFDFISEMNKR